MRTHHPVRTAAEGTRSIPSARALSEAPTTPSRRSRTRRQHTTGAALAGQRIGPYQILEVVGRGGMGVVYKGYHAALERTVAIKVMKGLEHDAEAGRRFEREAKTSARLRHPHILSVFDFGEVDGSPYMVTEYLSGGTLAERLRDHPRLEAADALKLLRGVAEALDFAHQRRVIHRDIKPSNILLDDHDEPVLADFGLAKVLHESALHTTGLPTGTPAYVSPEQITDKPVGPAADRYSFAVMAYQLVVGRLPFPAGDFMRALYAHVQEEPPAPSAVATHLPATVDPVLLRGLAKDPASRWATCGEMVDALEAALTGAVVLGAPVAATAEPATATTLVLPFAAAAAAAVPGEDRRTGRRVAGWFWAAGAFGLGFLLFLGLAALLRPAPPAPSLGLSVDVVRPGQQLTIHAASLPAGGHLQLDLSGEAKPLAQGVANGAGAWAVTSRVPLGTAAGTHQVQVCWNGACPLGATLTVMSLPTPTPASKPRARPQAATPSRPRAAAAKAGTSRARPGSSSAGSGPVARPPAPAGRSTRPAGPPPSHGHGRGHKGSGSAAVLGAAACHGHSCH